MKPKSGLAYHKNEVTCEISEIRIRNNNGSWTDGIQAVCSKCGQMTDSYGTGEKSIKRSLAVLSSKCLLNEDNFYIRSTEEK